MLSKAGLEPIQASVAKGIGTAIAERASQRVLYVLRQTIDAGTHVDGFDDQPYLVWRRHHGSCLRKSAGKVTLSPGNAIRQPPGLRSRTTPIVAGVPTLTGTRVKQPFAAAIASLCFRRQR